MDGISWHQRLRRWLGERGESKTDSGPKADSTSPKAPSIQFELFDSAEWSRPQAPSSRAKNRSGQVAILILALLAHQLVGCTEVERPEETAISAVCGIDISGSIRLRDAARERCAQVIRDVDHGHIAIRQVGRASYRSESHVLELDLPAVPACENPFVDHCPRLRARQLTAVAGLKEDALRQLSAFPASTSDETDIFGFLAAAADWMRATGESAEKVIYLSTDLVDTVGHDPGDLSGIQLVVFQQQDDDPGEAQARRQVFDSIVVHAGAEGPVRYEPLQPIRETR